MQTGLPDGDVLECRNPGRVEGDQEAPISAARQLMLRRGQADTGIDETCREAGVSKGVFHRPLPSKEAPADAALKSFDRRGLDELESIDVSGASPAGA